MDAENRSVQQKHLDQWLDAALRARFDAEPNTGLEQRILSRLVLEPTRKQFVFWPAFAAIAVLLVVGFGIVLMRTGTFTPTVVTRNDRTQNPADGNRQPAIQAKLVPREAEQQRARHARGKATRCCAVLASRSLKNSKSLPKLAIFPTPRPETEQEHLLFRLAAQQGSLETASLSPDLPIRELSVPELKIGPMEGTPPDNPPQH
jgi:hypothetical protein